jgi:hypothetical protein
LVVEPYRIGGWNDRRMARMILEMVLIEAKTRVVINVR